MKLANVFALGAVAAVCMGFVNNAVAADSKCHRSALEPVCVGDKAIYQVSTGSYIQPNNYYRTFTIALEGDVTAIDLYTHQATVSVPQVSPASIDMRELYVTSGCTTVADQKVCVGDKIITGERDLIRNTDGGLPVPRVSDVVVGINPTSDQVAILRGDVKINYYKINLVQKSDLVISGGCTHALCVGDEFSARTKVDSYMEPGYEYLTYTGVITGIQGSGDDAQIYYKNKEHKSLQELSPYSLLDIEVLKYSDKYAKNSSVRGVIPVGLRVVPDTTKGSSVNLLLAMWAAGSTKIFGADPTSTKLIEWGQENQAGFRDLTCTQTKNQSECSFVVPTFNDATLFKDVKIHVSGAKAKNLIKALLDHGAFNSSPTVDGASISLSEVNCDQTTRPESPGTPEERASCQIEDNHLGYTGPMY